MLWGPSQTQGCLVGGNPAQFGDGNVCKDRKVSVTRTFHSRELNETGTWRVGLVRDTESLTIMNMLSLFLLHMPSVRL